MNEVRGLIPEGGQIPRESIDVLVLGTGIAGCAAALAAAREGADVTVVTRAREVTESNTFYAQGGIVARPPGDSPELLAADIERAGDGLCDPEAVDRKSTRLNSSHIEPSRMPSSA